MNSRDRVNYLNDLHRRSDRAGALWAVWTAVSAAGLFWLIVTSYDLPYDVISYALPALTFVCGLLFAVMYAFRYARLNGLMWDDFDNDGGEPVAHDILDFEDTARAGGTRLVARIDNQLLLSRFQFEPSDWRLLIRHLRPNYPKWQRAALDNTKLFTNITAPGEFNRISREFERMQIIKGKPRHWVITGEGWEALHEAAHMQVVTK